MTNNVLVVFAKAPVAGQVKTRLCPPYTHEEAAQLYQSWARDVYSSAARLPNTTVLVAYLPDPAFPTPDWMGEATVPFFEQRGPSLTERLPQAFARGFELASKVAVIGTDSPGLPREYLARAFQTLEQFDVALGPTPDGGYYLLALKAAAPPELFQGIAWSTDQVMKQTLDAARRLGLSVHLLPEYQDVDRAEDLVKIPEHLRQL